MRLGGDDNATRASTTPYVEPSTNITMQRFVDGAAGFGFAMSLPAAGDNANSFIGRMEFPVAKGAGYGAVRMRGDPDGPVLMVATDGRTVWSSCRRSASGEVGGDVGSAASVHPIVQGSHVNETTMTYMFMCEDCLDTSAMDMAGSIDMSWAIGGQVIDDDANRVTGFHEMGSGCFTAEIANAWSAQFDAWAATAMQPVAEQELQRPMGSEEGKAQLDEEEDGEAGEEEGREEDSNDESRDSSGDEGDDEADEEDEDEDEGEGEDEDEEGGKMEELDGDGEEEDGKGENQIAEADQSGEEESPNEAEMEDSGSESSSSSDSSSSESEDEPEDEQEDEADDDEMTTGLPTATSITPAPLGPGATTLAAATPTGVLGANQGAIEQGAQSTSAVSSGSSARRRGWDIKITSLWVGSVVLICARLLVL